MTRTPFTRAAALISVLRHDPGEFLIRLSAIVAGRVEPLRHRRPAYAALDWNALVAALPAELREPVRAALAEPELQQIEAHVARTAQTLVGAPIDSRHNGDTLLGRCCYALVRVLRPQVVVETGVAHGVTTAFILTALARNERGRLHSIDLPPHEPGANDYVGAFVPARLRSAWRLHRGWSERVLPALVAELGHVDMFVHDSMHTYQNMSFEFATVLRRMPEHGAIVADDIEGNRAFMELQEQRPHFWGVCAAAAKPALFGVVIR